MLLSEQEEARLKSKIWVQAAIRTCETMGIAAYVVRKGDEDAGSILIKQNFMGDGFRVLIQTRSPNGKRAWLAGTGHDPVLEKDADAYISRQMKYDTDLWVIEIEERKGMLPFDEPVL